jgi:hypothetical protein
MFLSGGPLFVTRLGGLVLAWAFSETGVDESSRRMCRSADSRAQLAPVSDARRYAQCRRTVVGQVKAATAQ